MPLLPTKSKQLDYDNDPAHGLIAPRLSVLASMTAKVCKALFVHDDVLQIADCACTRRSVLSLITTTLEGGTAIARAKQRPIRSSRLSISNCNVQVERVEPIPTRQTTALLSHFILVPCWERISASHLLTQKPIARMRKRRVRNQACTHLKSVRRSC